MTQLFDVARARSAAFCQSAFTAPWGLDIADEAPLGLVTPLEGEAWVCLPGESPAHLETGDVAVVTGGLRFTVADSPDTKPHLTVLPGNRVITADGSDITDSLKVSPHTNALRRGGEAAEARGSRAVIASGTYAVAGDVNRRLLAVLPPLIHLRRAKLSEGIMSLLASEAGRDQPGQQVVLDRLLDLVLVACLNAWFAGEGAARPGWHRAHGDPLIAKAITAMHRSPERSWTVASLAQHSGVSRASFARRFADVVGETPMSYLTGHRIELAADLLRDSDATIDAVAAQVGYANGSALSVAFTRLRNERPGAMRAA